MGMIRCFPRSFQKIPHLNHLQSSGWTDKKRDRTSTIRIKAILFKPSCGVFWALWEFGQWALTKHFFTSLCMGCPKKLPLFHEKLGLRQIFTYIYSPYSGTKPNILWDNGFFFGTPVYTKLKKMHFLQLLILYKDVKSEISHL